MEGERGGLGAEFGPVDRRLGRWCSVVFVLALAWVALLFYGGNIGRWNDDYFFARQFHRDASFTSGDTTAPMPVRSWVLDGPMHFWRPLYRVVWTPIVTALWQIDSGRWLHVIAACCHVAVCAGLWWFLRSLGAGRTAAAIAALAFLVYPADFEGAFWPPCTPTPFATGLMLLALWLQARWTRFVDRSPAHLGPPVCSPAMLAAAPAALAFAASCFNEQPGFLVLAMPLMVWCARGGAASAGARWGGWVTLAPSALALAAVAAYALVARSMHPAQVSERTGGLVESIDLLHHAREFAMSILSRHDLKHFARGALAEGRTGLLERPTVSIVAGSVLLIAGLGWAWLGTSAWAADARDLAEGEHPRVRGRGLVLLGLAAFVVAWAPLTLIHYPASPRLAYAPGMGLAIALAGIVEMITRRWRMRPLTHVLLRAAAVPALIAAAVMMVGVQHAYRARFQADQREAAALRRLVPDLPTAVRPVLVPMRIADRPVHTGVKGFDRYFMPALTSDWAAGWWAQVLYRREDVQCVRGTRPGGALEAAPKLRLLDTGQVKTATPLSPPATSKSRVFDLAQVVPFDVSPDGEVQVYTHIVVRPSGGFGTSAPGEPVLLPAIAAAFQKGLVPQRVLAVTRAAAEPPASRRVGP